MIIVVVTFDDHATSKYIVGTMENGQIVSFANNAKGCPTSWLGQPPRQNGAAGMLFVYVCCLSTPIVFVWKTDFSPFLLWKRVSLKSNIYVMINNVPADSKVALEH